MKVKVSAGYQLGLPETDKLYQPGDTFDAPDDLANEWIESGLAVKAQAASSNKAVTSAETPNKAVTKSTKSTKKR